MGEMDGKNEPVRITLAPVRRRNKKIGNLEEVERIPKGAFICRIAMCEGDRPYCVPMICCYKGGRIYLHSAKEGKKLEVLKANNRVCFEVETGVEVVRKGKPCS